MTGLGFALLLLAALCADSLPNEALLPMAGMLVVLALAVAMVSNTIYIKKTRKGNEYQALHEKRSSVYKESRPRSCNLQARRDQPYRLTNYTPILQGIWKDCQVCRIRYTK